MPASEPALPPGLEDGAPFLVSYLFVLTGLCKSRGEAQRLIRDGGAYLNNRKLTPPDELIFDYDLLHGTWVILRKGKKHVAAVEFTINPEPRPREWWIEWSDDQGPVSHGVREDGEPAGGVHQEPGGGGDLRG